MTEAVPGADTLLTADFMRQLERLTLVARRAYAGTMKGEKKSIKRGTSVEFADFRTYAPGDDFRSIDWNVYGRLDKLFLKLFMEEEDLHVTLIIDASGSMDFGEPSKLTYAMRLAAALGYIALHGMDRLSAFVIGDRILDWFPAKRGRAQVFPLFDFLQRLAPQERTDLHRVLKDVARRVRRPGLTVVLSDFLAPSGYEDGLKALLTAGHELTVLQILEPDELQPPYTGDLRLIDAETGAPVEVTLGEVALRRYRNTVDAFTGGLRRWCRKYGAHYALAATDQPFDDIVLQSLRSAGFVR